MGSPAGQVQVYFQFVVGVRRDNKGPWLYGEQVVFTHEPQNTLAVYNHTLPA